MFPSLFKTKLYFFALTFLFLTGNWHYATCAKPRVDAEDDPSASSVDAVRNSNHEKIMAKLAQKKIGLPLLERLLNERFEGEMSMEYLLDNFSVDVIVGMLEQSNLLPKQATADDVVDALFLQVGESMNQLHQIRMATSAGESWTVTELQKRFPNGNVRKFRELDKQGITIAQLEGTTLRLGVPLEILLQYNPDSIVKFVQNSGFLANEPAAHAAPAQQPYSYAVYPVAPQDQAPAAEPE